MLFSSWPFIAAFLPVTWIVYRFLLKNTVRDAALLWLVVASLFFYGWFKWSYLLIICLSLALNYGIGLVLSRRNWPAVKRKALLAFGIAGNLGALFYYKYAGLFFKTLNAAGGDFTVPDILLPIGISFFTFQSIAWLVDSYRRESEEPDFLHYALFITFFPQLIAGPIVHHKEVMPQFMRQPGKRRRQSMLAMGLTVFVIGLFKKVAIADHMGEIADPVFNSAAVGVPLTIVEAWLGPLAYTLQIYFDFSGYSDMAVGLAALFGLRLPLNFFSPYKSADIIEFWRRWHITLSRFLRDYLYIPLGGNRRGRFRQQANLMITMLLGGLWHGANWTFMLWGGLHGLYLMIAHGWKKISPWRLPRGLAVAVTFLSVVIAWIFFRAENLASALHLLRCMAGVNGFALQDTQGWLADAVRAVGIDVQGVGTSRNLRINEKWYVFWVALAAVFIFPSVHEITRSRLAIDVTGVAKGVRSWWKFHWVPTIRWALLCGFAGGLAMLLLTRVNAFIYFQF